MFRVFPKEPFPREIPIKPSTPSIPSTYWERGVEVLQAVGGNPIHDGRRQQKVLLLVVGEEIVCHANLQLSLSVLPSSAPLVKEKSLIFPGDRVCLTFCLSPSGQVSSIKPYGGLSDRLFSLLFNHI